MLDDRQILSEHHREAARMWGTGGPGYDDVSFSISDALGHAAQRLQALDGERVLDVATGTGWSARAVARYGARVSAIDISPELLEAAEALSAHVRPPIEFKLAPAEELPFPDAAFDRIISTFGVMFADDQQRAAAELGRVCRPGGRLVLATWTPDGAVAKFFGLLAGYAGGPPPAASPLAWGEPAQLRKLLGRDFELSFEPGVNNSYFDTVEDVWKWYARGFGPVRALLDALPAERREALKRDVDAYHRNYMTPAGLRITRDYLVVIGRRR